VTGVFNLTFEVTDSTGAGASKTLPLLIAAPARGVGVDINGSIDAINAKRKYLTVGGVNVYYNAKTIFILNTAAGTVTSTGKKLPVGVAVGMPIQGTGGQNGAGKIIATVLEIN
jgi:hypothetical protein